VPVPRDPRRRARPLTWRSLADAPVGFDCALTSGDAELARGNLTTAARCFADALRRARRQRGESSPYFRSEAELHILTLAGICLTPPLALRPATEGERWAALHELARLGALADCQPAIVHLGSMLYRARRNRETLSEEGRAAWDLLMTCRGLPLEALEFLDDRLLGEGLWGLRPRLATHPDATRDLWLAMLQAARTPDLVSTIWEIEGAAEDAEVKAALKGSG
jgi:hypothetical protein